MYGLPLIVPFVKPEATPQCDVCGAYDHDVPPLSVSKTPDGVPAST